MTTEKNLVNNIKDALEINEELDLGMILDGGLLLGIHRDGGVIKGDEDDVDFAVPYDVVQFKFKQTIDAFVERGFELFRLRDTVMTFKRNGVKIDLLVYKELNDDYYYLTLYHNKKPFALKIPKAFLDKVHEVHTSLDDMFFYMPRDLEGYLEWRFGDWKTPILRPAFSFTNYLTKPGLTEWL